MNDQTLQKIIELMIKQFYVQQEFSRAIDIVADNAFICNFSAHADKAIDILLLEFIKPEGLEKIHDAIYSPGAVDVELLAGYILERYSRG